MSKDTICSVSRFGIRIGVFNVNAWSELSNTNNCNLPFVVGRYYTHKNEWKEDVSCGFEVIGQFVDVDDAKRFYEEKSKYLML